MSKRDDAEGTVEFGFQTPNSKTVLMVTNDLAEAEHVLDLLGGGTLVRRTVGFSPWRPVVTEGGAPSGQMILDPPARRPESTSPAPWMEPLVG
jgi:hypothetical protein